MRIKPILFNTDMVRAILDGRKTVTRRCVKYKYSNTEMKMHIDKYGTRLIEIQKDIEGETFGKNTDGSTWHKLRAYIEPQAPYKRGDILYVRETWSELSSGYEYKVDGESIDHLGNVIKWHPSIHMPKEAARIWLKVKNVRVERLQDITEEQAKSEGICRLYDHLSKEEYEEWARKIGKLEKQEDCTFKNYLWHGHFGKYGTGNRLSDAWEHQYSDYENAVGSFSSLWNATVDLKDWNRYGWGANPWVWVIEFERCEKPEGW